MTPSPFAPTAPISLPDIAGIDMAVAATGLRYQNRPDFWILRGQKGAQVAGVFTRSQTPGEPVIWSRSVLGQAYDGARVIAVNAGNANVFTGEAGRAVIEATTQYCAQSFDVAPQSVLIASTGVIGEPFAADILSDHIPGMADQMSPSLWSEAAQAILTTDTFPKLATRKATIGGVSVTLNGIAKGSGMIAPNMATMLAFIATDANLPQAVLQNLLHAGLQDSFNAITVDSDSSTSDTLFLLASGAAAHPPITSADQEELSDFKRALFDLMHDLALQIIKDGEGISKLLKITVTGAESDDAARNIAFAIGNSPLVKTAAAGEDPNWGRIIMAIGKSGEPIKADQIKLYFGGILVAENGARAMDYTEETGQNFMRAQELDFRVVLGLGGGKATIYSSDLTHSYIDINADYRS